MYLKSNSEELKKEEFRNPSRDFRGAPFWAWNCRLDRETIRSQIHMLKEMGFGGFHIHVRTGMDTTYLSDEYMEYVRYAVEEGKKEQIRAWLYDEDRWPSGAAGGMVTKRPEYRARYLLFTPRPYGSPPAPEEGKPRFAQGRGGNREENGELLAIYDVVLGRNGELEEYRIYREGEKPRGVLWYAYLETAIPNPWFNNQTYVNTLEQEATETFLQITHERYAEVLQEEFGRELLAIFTDEPQHVIKGHLPLAKGKGDVFLPWTPSLQDSFRKEYGYDLLEKLPELFWELPENRISVTRYQYHNHVADRFVGGYCEPLGQWCRRHLLWLTGHVMLEPTLESQSSMVGEAMRCYPSFGLPGIDILCDRHEYNTAKQCQSVVHQTGAPGMLSELYGVTGWDYDFRSHKLQGDWQAALGVTLRVPHLAWMSMKGEAKRDYPASIAWQSPWWKDYQIIEDYFARVNTVMTRGLPCVDIGIIHPIESYWLHWGPQDQTSAVRAQMEERFSHLTELLLFSALDFDFISEALLSGQIGEAGNLFAVGKMKYRTVVVPACETLRESTVECLENFLCQGGRLLFIGPCPVYMDARRDEEIRARLEHLYQAAGRIEFEDSSILAALEKEKRLEIRNAAGNHANMLLHQIRQEGEDYWVFIARGRNPVSPDVDPADILTFTFRGAYRIHEYDALTGEIRSLEAEYIQGNTVIRRPWHLHDSLLLRLMPAEQEETAHTGRAREVQEKNMANVCRQEAQEKTMEISKQGERNGHDSEELSSPKKEPGRQFQKVKVILDEPNACLLDMAEYALDGEEFRPMEEILRLDNACRRRAGLPERNRNVMQPYLIRKEKPSHKIRLRFSIKSEIVLEKLHLALEDRGDTEIVWNGKKVEAEADGWYVDRAIETVPLSGLKTGINMLELTVPLGAQTNTENCFLLGDFGVRVEGTIKTLIPPVRILAFGDIVTQGLPFYTGNLTYEYDVETRGEFTIRIPQYRGAAVKVGVDGQEKGIPAFAPYECRVSDVEPGRHRLSLTLLNTRQNGFGQLHHTSSVDFYQSPDSWRSVGNLWCYEYQFRKCGILVSPEIFC